MVDFCQNILSEACTSNNGFMQLLGAFSFAIQGGTASGDGAFAATFGNAQGEDMPSIKSLMASSIVVKLACPHNAIQKVFTFTLSAILP